MIARILPSTSFSKIIDYHFQKIAKGVAKNLTEGLENLKKKEALVYINEPTKLREKIKHRKPLKNEPIFHVSLSLNHDEKLSDEIFLSLAKDYLKAMGFKDHNVLFFRHDDTDHTHIHIVCNRIGLEKFNVTERSFEKLTSVKISRRLENIYGLKETLHDKGKNLALDRAQQQREGLLAKLKESVQKSLNASYSMDSYRSNLLNNGIVLYLREKDGKIKAGYRFKHYGKTHYFHSYNIGRDIKPENLVNSFKNKDEKTRVRNTLKGIFNRFDKIETISDFKTILKAEGIEFKLSKYNDNRIFGISFISGNQEFKGSDIGYSWDTLKDYFVSFEDSIQIPDRNNELLYRILLGQGKNVNQIPVITPTELKSLNPELQKNYFKHFALKSKYYNIKDFFESLKLYNAELEINSGKIVDIKVNNFRFASIGLDIESLNQLSNKNIENELYHVCPGNNVGFIKNFLEQKLKTDIVIKGNLVSIYNQDYSLSKYGYNHEKVQSSSKAGRILGFDQNNWIFNDMDEKKKKRSKEEGNNQDIEI